MLNGRMGKVIYRCKCALISPFPTIEFLVDGEAKRDHEPVL